MARCRFRLARGGPVINIASLVNIGEVERAVSHSHELPSVTPPLRLGSWAVCYDTQGCGQRGGPDSEPCGPKLQPSPGHRPAPKVPS